ncbi:MAG: PmoA family protein [Burkholderiales bacterium]|nr:PmoA family protein [Burkholderiales bacterium]GIK87865.1 MAG: hypothetical protein BroJett026_33460 [Betaproteobacteria bacterium]
MPLTFDDRAIALPAGAWAGAERGWVRRDGRPLLAFTPGALRPYIFPLYTPAGFAVTSEAPADHPHHQSLWIAADHVHALVPASEGRVEEYTYNFYLDTTFQGRAPGRLVGTSLAWRAAGERDALVEQSIDWRGPVEWAAPQGRVILSEVRRHAIRALARATLVVVRSRLAAAAWPVRIGPTRHAWFNVRVAESMQALHGGTIRREDGTDVGRDQTPQARWIDYAGPVGGGHVAGIAVLPLSAHPDTWWFVADWGVVTWNPWRRSAQDLAPAQALEIAVAVVAHDGEARPDDLASWHRECIEMESALR